jgi:hypothetical protein
VARAVLLPAGRDRDVRLAAAGALGVAALWPLMPVHPPFACPLRAATGIPCPFCGLTRAVTAAAHGDIASSLSYNPIGLLVVVAVVVAIVWPALLRRIRPPTWTLWAGLGVLWLWNIGFNPTFHQLLLP